MKRLHTEIDIDAAPERVWSVLVDLARYADWNPFIVEADGRIEAGTRLRLRMAPPGGRQMTLEPSVTVVDPGRRLEWLGHVAFPGVFSGRHQFVLHQTETGTRLEHGETFTGVLVPFLARSLDAHTLPGLVALNDALKVQAEKVAVAG